MFAARCLTHAGDDLPVIHDWQSGHPNATALAQDALGSTNRAEQAVRCLQGADRRARRGTSIRQGARRRCLPVTKCSFPARRLASDIRRYGRHSTCRCACLGCCRTGVLVRCPSRQGAVIVEPVGGVALSCLRRPAGRPGRLLPLSRGRRGPQLRPRRGSSAAPIAAPSWQLVLITPLAKPWSTA
jgi:hypothetical protein